MGKMIAENLQAVVRNDEPVLSGSYAKSDRPTLIYGYEKSPIGNSIFWTLTVLTLGVFYLVISWIPLIQFKLRFRPCPLSRATAGLIFAENGKRRGIEGKRIKVSNSTITHSLSRSSSSSDITTDAPQDVDEDDIRLVGGTHCFQYMGDEADSLEEAEKDDIPSTTATNMVDAARADQPQVNASALKSYRFPDESVETLLLEYDCLRYIWLPIWNEFHHINFTVLYDSSLSNSSKVCGISEDLANERRSLYGTCEVLIPGQSILFIVFEEILHPFYVFQLAAIALWFYDEYYLYAVSILFITAFSSIMQFVGVRRERKALQKLAHFECSVSLRRLEDTTSRKRSSVEIVPGDVFEVENGMILPCDSLLLNGTAIVDEAMLTGESVPILKRAVSERTAISNNNFSGKWQEEESSTILYAGTKVLITEKFGNKSQAINCIALRTGFDSLRGRLLRRILHPMPMRYDLIKDSYRYLGILFVLALVGSLISFGVSFHFPLTLEEKLIRFLDIYTTAVPPALPAALTVGMTLAVNRLWHRFRVRCVSPPRINVAGGVRWFVFDKTGTLTDDSLVLQHCVPATSGLIKPVKFSTDLQVAPQVYGLSDPAGYNSTNLTNLAALPAVERSTFSFTTAVATCHSLTKLNGEIIGESLEKELLQFSNWKLSVSDDQNDTDQPASSSNYSSFPILAIVEPPYPIDDDNAPSFSSSKLHIIKRFEFKSTLQRMSVLVRNPRDDSLITFCKGSPEVLRGMCAESSIPQDYDEVIKRYATSGMRILSIAGMVVPAKTWAEVDSLDREFFESELTFLGLLVFSNRMKDDTADSIAQLIRAGCRCSMATGDNAYTAAAVALHSGMIHKDSVDSVLVDMEDDAIVCTNWSLQSSSSMAMSGMQVVERQPSQMASDVLRDLFNTLLLSVPSTSDIHIKDAGKAGKFGGGDLLEKSRYLQSLVTAADAIFFKHKICCIMTGRAMRVLHRHFDRLSSVFDHKYNVELFPAPASGTCCSCIDCAKNKKSKHSSRVPNNKKKSADTHANTVELGKADIIKDSCESLLENSKFEGVTVSEPIDIYSNIRVEQLEGISEMASGIRLAYTAIFRHIQVFARMSPLDKRLLVSALQRSPVLPYVAMCGDGANDCDALNAADMSVSLSDAEASVAATFKVYRKSIGGCINVLKEGRASLINSIQVFKFIFLYAFIQASAVLVMYMIGTNLSDIQYMFSDVIVVLPLSIFMSWTDVSPTLSKLSPPDQLMNPVILFSVFFQSLLQLAFQGIALLILRSQSFYAPFVPTAETGEGEDDLLACTENTILFVATLVQYAATCIAFSNNHPWRKPIYTNIPLCTWLLGTLLIAVLLLVGPPSVATLKDWFIAVPMPTPFVWGMFAYFCGNVALTILIEWLTKYYFSNHRLTTTSSTATTISNVDGHKS